jgi:hypothetical protein
MNWGTEFAPAYGMVDVTGTYLLPDQPKFVPSTIQLYCQREGQSSYSPNFPPCNGLYADANYIVRRPRWQPPASMSEAEWRNGLNWAWQTTGGQQGNQNRNRYCFL